MRPDVLWRGCVSRHADEHPPTPQESNVTNVAKLMSNNEQRISNNEMENLKLNIRNSVFDINSAIFVGLCKLSSI